MLSQRHTNAATAVERPVGHRFQSNAEPRPSRLAPRSPGGQRVPVRAPRAGDSPRLDGASAEHVRVLAESGVVLPPILVHRTTMRVIDGMHRLQAAQLRGDETIGVQFFDGADDDAFIAAVRANVTHGLPLTRRDREAAAARIVDSHPHLSDRSIATITGLGARKVADIRQRRGSGGAGQAAVRIGRDGRTRPLSSAHARRLASDAIAERPHASLREVARLVGLSPTTVRDVRERMRRGEDPVPVGRAANGWTTRRMSGERPAPVQPAARSDAINGRERDDGPDRTQLLENLNKDPSLRFSESGRLLLRALFVGSGGPPAPRLLNSLPPHCAYTLRALARFCAKEWLDFAAHLERRFDLHPADTGM